MDLIIREIRKMRTERKEDREMLKREQTQIRKEIEAIKVEAKAREEKW